MWTGCLLARLCHGSQNLVAWVLILLTVGGVMQVMLMGEDAADGFRLCRKFAAAFVLSAAGVTAFYKMSWYKKEHAVAGMACLSLMIFGIMFLFGSDVGDGAVVNLKVGTRSFQVLELLKVLYIFVMAGLLGKGQLKDKQVMGLKRPWAAFIFTVLNIGFLALLGELGTALLIAALGGGMFLAGEGSISPGKGRWPPPWYRSWQWSSWHFWSGRLHRGFSLRYITGCIISSILKRTPPALAFSIYK